MANGPQCITGQINTELVKPHTDHPFFVNLFGNSLGRVEANMHLNSAWKPSLSTGLLLHASGQQREFDRNDDQFLEPTETAAIEWHVPDVLSAGNMNGQFNVHGIQHRQEGGQLCSVEDAWRIKQDNDRVEVFGKNGYVFEGDRYQSIGFIYNAYAHTYRGQYGSERILATNVEPM